MNCPKRTPLRASGRGWGRGSSRATCSPHKTLAEKSWALRLATHRRCVVQYPPEPSTHSGTRTMSRFAVLLALCLFTTPLFAYQPKPQMRPLTKDVKPFEYVPGNVPFYPKSDRWGVTGENIKKMQKPLSPEESMKHITTPVEFELKLFV